MEKDLIERKVSSKQVFDGKLLKVYSDEILLPNGKSGVRELIRHNGAVAIVALTNNDEIIVEKQFRYPMEKVIYEIPAGKLDSKDEDHLEAAKRELREETGYSAQYWKEIGVYYPSPAYTDEKIYIYIAKGLTKGERKLDEDEFLDYTLLPFNTFLNMCLNGEVEDGKTLTAVFKTKLLRENNSYKTLPILPSFDIEKASSFYENLGFVSVSYLDKAEPHICLYKDNSEIILTKSNKKITPHHIQYGYGYDLYITTKDVKKEYEELKAKDIKIIKELGNTDYDNNEFVFEDVDGRWICVGCKNSTNT